MTPEHLPNPDEPEVQNVEIDAKLYERITTTCEQIGLRPTTLLNAIVEEFLIKFDDARREREKQSRR